VTVSTSKHREQHRRGDGERRTAPAACPGDERAHRDEDHDLQQERAAPAGVVAAMQLMVQAAVEPGDPHQREHRAELAKPAPGHLPGQVVGRLGDQHDHGEVVEELEWAYHALMRLLPMRARRLSQAAQPGQRLPASAQGRDGRVSVQLTISRRSANSQSPSRLANWSR
jgi:hypothetical protein